MCSPHDGTWKPNLEHNAPLGAYTLIVNSDEVVVLGALDEEERHRLTTSFYDESNFDGGKKQRLSLKHKQVWAPSPDKVPLVRLA